MSCLTKEEKAKIVSEFGHPNDTGSSSTSSDLNGRN